MSKYIFYVVEMCNIIVWRERTTGETIFACCKRITNLMYTYNTNVLCHISIHVIHNIEFNNIEWEGRDYYIFLKDCRWDYGGFNILLSEKYYTTYIMLQRIARGKVQENYKIILFSMLIIEHEIVRINNKSEIYKSGGCFVKTFENYTCGDCWLSFVNYSHNWCNNLLRV